MNLLIPSLPELHFLHAKRFKYHEHIELMTKEITEIIIYPLALGKSFQLSWEKRP